MDRPLSDPPPGIPGALLVDLYELTMADAYLAEGIADTPATFSLFSRRVPPDWGHLVSCGVADVLAYLEGLRFGPADLAALGRLGVVSRRLLEHLEGFRFTGSVRAMPEGTPFGAHAPVLEVSGGLLEAQIVESAVVNLIHLPVLACAKASRCVEAAAGRRLVEFGMRRTHGGDAALRVARAAYIAGFDATSDVAAAVAHGIPVAGTMAHSWVQAHPDDESAFRAYLGARPGPAVLLVDTYDTLAGVDAAIRATADEPSRLAGVRLDSGDVVALAHGARRRLDAAGRQDAIVFVSGGLDEHEIARIVAAGAPVDAFGVGTRLGVVADSPGLDMAYKLVEVGGRPTLKLSGGKATWPGAKQVWRTPRGDVIALAGEDGPDGGVPLLVEVMRAGRPVRTETADDARRRLAEARAGLPAACTGTHARPVPTRFSDAARLLRDRTAAPHLAG